MTQHQRIESLSKKEIFEEYAFLESKKVDILAEITSNRLCIEEQFLSMELIIAEGVKKIVHLIELDMSLAKLNTYIAMAFLNQVEDHDVEFKYLTRLPSLFFKMHMNKICILKSIKIDGRYNDIRRLPPEIGFLHQLEMLDLNHCSLSELPKEIGLLKSLHNINLDFNEMSFVPIEICQLTDLEELHLRHNHLRDLPLALARLEKLRKIDVAENDIATLPAVFNKYIH